MIDQLKILEQALRCNVTTDTTKTEREVLDILINLPELVFYGKDKLVPWSWGWKRRRSALNTPLAPLPSPVGSLPRKPKFKPRVAFTKEQFRQETNALAQRKKQFLQKPNALEQRKKAYQEELLKQISELTKRKQVYEQELLKVESHLQKQRKFNNTLRKFAARATTVAPSRS